MLKSRISPAIARHMYSVSSNSMKISISQKPYNTASETAINAMVQMIIFASVFILFFPSSFVIILCNRLQFVKLEEYISTRSDIRHCIMSTFEVFVEEMLICFDQSWILEFLIIASVSEE